MQAGEKKAAMEAAARVKAKADQGWKAMQGKLQIAACMNIKIG